MKRSSDECVFRLNKNYIKRGTLSRRSSLCSLAISQLLSRGNGYQGRINEGLLAWSEDCLKEMRRG